MPSEEDQEILLEISNVAAGGCSIPLADLVGRRIVLGPNTVTPRRTGEISQVPADRELAACSYAKIIGVQGTVLVVMNKMNALLIADIVQRPGIKVENESGIILQRIADMLAGSYVATLNTFLSTALRYEETQMITAFVDDLIDMVLLDLYPETEEVYVVQTGFKIEQSDIAGHLFLLTDISGVNDLIQHAKALSVWHAPGAP